MNEKLDDFAQPRRQPQTKVFSVRLTNAERQRLAELAGSVPLGTYIRERLLSPEDTHPRLVRHRHRSIDHALLSRVLATLGDTRLSSNLNQLAKAVHLGVLPATPETETEIVAACEAVVVMRRALIAALGGPP